MEKTIKDHVNMEADVETVEKSSSNIRERNGDVFIATTQPIRNASTPFGDLFHQRISERLKQGPPLTRREAEAIFEEVLKEYAAIDPEWVAELTDLWEKRERSDNLDDEIVIQ